ncbi:cupin domain-containing protein [Chitinophaga rhizophila]|uniref:Cupin domain-containing protein n=1 Tax=Chitinophaga rhizophila TaxID=2866212 RepID=A0ABS7GE94_9BACT|nr:cupin domain-containing protein [Chitinophaga rhizophila]MBW8685990.1 cupin domain-containing protein [Chitinophaga rhizophila]
MIINLSGILSPYSKTSFLQDYFEQSVLVVNRQDAHFFQAFPLFDDIASLIEKAVSPAAYAVVLEDSAGALAAEQYMHIRSLPGNIKFKYGVDINKVFQLYSSGAAIVVVNNLHEQFAAVDQLKYSLEAELGCTCDSHILLQAAGAVPSRAAYETTEMFILQLSGRTQWKICEGPIQQPLSSQTDIPFDADQLPVVSECTTAAGDTLYIPRGYVYTAYATDENAVLLKVKCTFIPYLRLLLDQLKDIGLSSDLLRRSGFLHPTDNTTGPAEATDMLTAQLNRQLTVEALESLYMRRRPVK